MRHLPHVAILVALAASPCAMGVPARADELTSKGAPPQGVHATGAQAKTAARSAEQALRARVKGFWDARLAGSEKVYAYYLPQEKGGPTRAETTDGTSVIWKEYQIEGVKIDGESAMVTIQGKVALNLPKPTPVPEEMTRPRVKEVWRRTDGVWYREPVPLGLSKQVRPNVPSPDKARAQVAPDGGSTAKDAAGEKK